MNHTPEILVWHSGPPPHKGWWQASVTRAPGVWRWWNGFGWSFPATDILGEDMASTVARLIETQENQAAIEWTDAYPENARVPRIDPRTLDAGPVSTSL